MRNALIVCSSNMVILKLLKKKKKLSSFQMLFGKNIIFYFLNVILKVFLQKKINLLAQRLWVLRSSLSALLQRFITQYNTWNLMLKQFYKITLYQSCMLQSKTNRVSTMNQLSLSATNMISLILYINLKL